MHLRNLRLTLASVNTTSNKKDFQATQVGTTYVRGGDGNLTREIQHYIIHVIANKGDILKFKVPSTLAEKITQLHDALLDDVIVTVTFKNPKFKAYAMRGNDGNIISGIAASADDFEFEIHETDIIDFDELNN